MASPKHSVTRITRRSDIDIEELRRAVRYDPSTGKLFVLCGDHEVERFQSDDGKGYLQGNYRGCSITAHRVVWALVHGCWPRQIDHINGCRSDNRLVNLREVSNLENGKNQFRPVNNTSGRIGVSWHKRHAKWQASIKFDGHHRYLGDYLSFEEACAARSAAERALGFTKRHGETRQAGIS